MPDKICLKSMMPEDIAQIMRDFGEGAYRSKQIFKWLMSAITDFDEMTDLSKDLRQKLRDKYFISHPTIEKKQVSALDGTVKYLFALEDGNCVESVVMQYEHGNSVCISTQAGCHMGCAFCASYEKGQTRNLTPAEMLDQVLFAQKDSGIKITRVVLMGTGEPLDNYDNVLTFLRLVSCEGGINIGMRHISLSTCGIVPRINDLAAQNMQLTLSVSLHAPFDELRDKIMPINKKYSIDKLMKSCRDYFEKTGRRISFEYAMIKDFNDTEACAKKLASLLHAMVAHVNLIPLNHVEGSALLPSDKATIRNFQNMLLKYKINATVRRSLGGDIDASCGQLRRKAIVEKRLIK